MNTELTSAMARLDAALDRLEAGIGRHFDVDQRRSDVEVELQVMGEDRSRLASELETATAQAARLEMALGHVGGRVDRAIGAIEDILASDLAGREAGA